MLPSLIKEIEESRLCEPSLLASYEKLLTYGKLIFEVEITVHLCKCMYCISYLFSQFEITDYTLRVINHEKHYINNMLLDKEAFFTIYSGITIIISVCILLLKVIMFVHIQTLTYVV